jgi:hypothetical protein
MLCYAMLCYAMLCYAMLCNECRISTVPVYPSTVRREPSLLFSVTEDHNRFIHHVKGGSGV